MIEHIEQIFTDIEPMLRKLKKASYEANMEKFRKEHGHIIDEMVGSVKNADDRDAALEAAGNDFAKGVHSALSEKRRISGRKQADLNFFMIYYVFPAILLTGEECADSLCVSIRDAWNAEFKGTNINYTDYDTLYASFRNKIFGIF